MNGEGLPPGASWTEANLNTEDNRIETYRRRAHLRALEMRRYAIQMDGILPPPGGAHRVTERKRAFEAALERHAQASGRTPPR